LEGKEMKIKILIFLLLIPNLYISAQDKIITPESYEWMCKTSINIMKTYKYYDSIIEKYDPKFLFDANTVQTFTDNYLITTKAENGTFSDTLFVGPFQGDLALYWKLKLKDSLCVSFIVFMTSFDLQIEKEIHPELRDENGPYGDLYGWKSRKFILAVRPDIFEKIKLTIGALIHTNPYVITAENEKKEFSIYHDEKNNEWRTFREHPELFLNGKVFGYEVRTLYEYKKSSINLLELNKKFKKIKDGEMELGLNYYKQTKAFQAGFLYENKNWIKFLPVSLEFFWDIYRKDHWSDLGYFVFNVSSSIFKNDYEFYDKKDFYIGFDFSSSYSKGMFAQGLWGNSWKVRFENIFRYFSMGFGFAYNEHKYLYRVPIKNEKMVLIDFRIMI